MPDYLAYIHTHGNRAGHLRGLVCDSDAEIETCLARAVADWGIENIRLVEVCIGERVIAVYDDIRLAQLSGIKSRAEQAV